MYAGIGFSDLLLSQHLLIIFNFYFNFCKQSYEYITVRIMHNYYSFEEEMRKIDPTVSLPYWDYTTDFYIPKPTDSVVWTDCFFGDSLGVVSTEFFKNFYGAHYSFISRNADKDNYGKLISHRDIADLMKHCSIAVCFFYFDYIGSEIK